MVRLLPLLSVTVRYCPLLSVTVWQVRLLLAIQREQIDNLLALRDAAGLTDEKTLKRLLKVRPLPSVTVRYCPLLSVTVSY